MLYREAGQFKSTYAAGPADLPDPAGPHRRSALLLVVAFVVVPLVGDQYWLSAILIPFLILSLAALGLNILTGYAGQLSLGTAAFMAVGAFMAYNFVLRIPGMPILGAFALGGAVRGGGRHRVRPAEPAHQGLLPRGGDARRQFFVLLGDQPRRLVLQPQLLGRDHRAARS